MGKALIASVNPAATALATSRFGVLGNRSLNISVVSTEARAQAVARVAGTFSKFAVNIDATGTSRTYRFRVNAANGNQVVNPTDTTAGVYSDNSNTDAVSAGDKFDFSTSSTGTPNAYWFRSVFEATTDHACYYSGSHGSYSTASAQAFFALATAGSGPLTSGEANVQAKARCAGTLRYFQAYISGNGRGTDSTYKTRINGADGNCTITVTAGATGLFEDTSSTDTVADGDLVNFAVTNGSGAGGIDAQFVGCWIVTTTGKNDLFSNFVTGTARAASGTASYHPFVGTPASSATEANASVQHGFDGRASRLRIYLSANTYSADATATLRIAAADVTQTITLTAGATGWFEDTTHTDDFTANQDCCVKIVGGTSGSITIRTIGVTEGPSTTAYTLTAAQGSFTLTGQAATLSRTRALAASQGSFALSGQAATLKRALNVAAAQGSFTLTGQAASFNLGHTIVAAQGSFTLSGQTATFRRTLNLSAAYGAYTLSGQTVTLKRALKLTADQGSFTLSGQAAALARGIRVTAARGTFTLTGQAATLTRSRAIAAAYGSFTLTGQDVAFLRDRRFSVEYGDFDLTGIAALFRRAFPGKSSAVSTSFTGRTAETNTSGFVGKSSAEATAFTGKTSAQS